MPVLIKQSMNLIVSRENQENFWIRNTGELVKAEWQLQGCYVDEYNLLCEIGLNQRLPLQS